MRWRAYIPNGIALKDAIEAPSWFLARQEAAVQLGVDHSGVTVEPWSDSPPATHTDSSGLRVRWSKKERDLVFEHDRHAPDGHLLYNALCCTPVGSGKPLVDELKARGFDVTTLRFTIKRAPGK